MNIDQQGLNELMLISLEQIDAAFNIWMSATFAVLITTHLVGNRLKTRVLYILAILYALFSLLYLGRIMNSGAFALMYAGEIEGFELPSFGIPLGVIRLIVFGVGTASTLYFLLRSSKEYRE